MGTESYFGTDCFCSVLRDFEYSRLDGVQHDDRECPDSIDQGCFIRDDIRRAAAMDLRHLQHCRVVPIDIARYDGLPAVNDLHHHHHDRIDILVQLRGMRALAFDDRLKLVTGRHH